MELPTRKKYGVIYADPPWDIGSFGRGKDTRIGRVYKVGSTVPPPYPVMRDAEIEELPVQDIAEENSHLWLWVTNRSFHTGFHVMKSWGFNYLNVLTFNKPSGVGAWFVNTTQHLLFGYRGKLTMGKGRYARTSQFYTPQKHSKKPESTYELIEAVSPFESRIELFARNRRIGWDAAGNEVTQ